jgi:2-polyprenyl-3-methyl-5-hydroxy-6-metoxy-1,4-benzoquinol methylase
MSTQIIQDSAFNLPTRCPACGSSSSRLVFSVSVSEATQHFVLREEYPERHRALSQHIGDLWGKESCDIRECSDCGFGFAHPFVAGDAEFYNLAYPRVNYPSTKWEYSATARKLEQRSRRPKGDVLDVGAGFGAFLDILKPQLTAGQTPFAIEYNNSAVTVLREKGYTVLQDDLRSSLFEQFEKRFAYIFLFQVVEHMDRLDDLFHRIKYLLTDDGSAFIAVPNTIRTNFQEQTGSLIDMPPNHIGRWTPQAFSALAQRTGLKLVSTEIEPFSVAKFIMVDLKFSHFKRAQDSGSIANRLRSLPASKARKLLETGLALAWAPVRAPVMLRAMRRAEPLGDSILIELSRRL